MLLKEKKEIIEWLEKYEVKNYTLRPDEIYGYVVDVEGSVYLWGKKLDNIAVKFGVVTGSFYCNNNQLTSLEGSPQSVGGDFDCCSNNQLTSLLGCPKIVGGSFGCNDNKLTSLEGGPEILGGTFYCDSNQLTSLEGSPHTVGVDFYCNNNKLTSLDGNLQTVGAGFYCDNNPDLGELQKMESFQEIKAYLLSKKLVIQLPHDLDNQKNNRKIKL